MPFLLGIDTGGTYTDAVLIESETETIHRSAKALTTHADLTLGLAEAISLVVPDERTASEVALVSISTTLATNALVEGQGDPVGVLAFGFSTEDLTRSGLIDAVGPGRVVALSGGHDAHGNERAPFPADEVEQAVDQLGDVAAVAIVGQFSVRNPAHEVEAAEVVRQRTGRPVCQSHELSARLDGPRRALTAALNASLLGLIDRLHRAVQAVMADRGIDAPLMVVRGDGSLVAASFAAARPIETILSGPAASVVGALHLTSVQSAVVVDMGGTTTDAAFISDGQAQLVDDGARVAGHRTMVEAVDMATVGLGGDSEVVIEPRERGTPIVVGPRRAIPLGRLGAERPEVGAMLRRQLDEPTGFSRHGRFVVATGTDEGADAAGLSARAQGLLARLGSEVMVEKELASTAVDQRVLDRLCALGLIRIATLTPSDVLSVLGATVPGVDRKTAELGARALARHPVRGVPVADSAEGLARKVVEAFGRRVASFLLELGLDADGIGDVVDDRLLRAALSGHEAVTKVRLSLTAPIVAIGAPAASWIPSAATQLDTDSIVPTHAEVANAVGAVVGRVRIRRSATITQPTKGQYRLHLGEGGRFGSVENARRQAVELLRESVAADADRAGAATPTFAEHWDERTAIVEGKTVFVEGTVTVEASGRPAF